MCESAWLVSARWKREFRAEIFNLSNTPPFGQLNGVVGSSAVGTITATATDSRVIQFGLKVDY